MSSSGRLFFISAVIINPTDVKIDRVLATDNKLRLTKNVDWFQILFAGQVYVNI
jgi:hypothetical protein